jgi:two-component system chemotaxis response regulator CheB
VIVQDEKTSEFSGMPAAAIRTGVADFVLPLSDIPGVLSALCASDVDTEAR